MQLSTTFDIVQILKTSLNSCQFNSEILLIACQVKIALFRFGTKYIIRISFRRHHNLQNSQ